MLFTVVTARLTGRQGNENAGPLLVVPVGFTSSVLAIPAGLYRGDATYEEEDSLHNKQNNNAVLLSTR